jgi:hypothetical protein
MQQLVVYWLVPGDPDANYVCSGALCKGTGQESCVGATQKRPLQTLGKGRELHHKQCESREYAK